MGGKKKQRAFHFSVSQSSFSSRRNHHLGKASPENTVGKGRKERRTPLVCPTREILGAWLKERAGEPLDPLFPTVTGGHLSCDAVERRLAHHVNFATASCPSLKEKRVTMHPPPPTPPPCACSWRETTSP